MGTQVKCRKGVRSGMMLEGLEPRLLLSHAVENITGNVLAAGLPWNSAKVTLYETGSNGAKQLGSGQTDALGHFEIRYRNADAGSQLYVVASDSKPGKSFQVFMGQAGEVGPGLLDSVVIDEYSTVSSAFALSQFIHGVKIFGSSIGLGNAVATTFNLVDGATGLPGAVVSNSNNGVSLDASKPSTMALQILDTLANVLASCAANPAKYATLFSLASVPGAPAKDTLQAILNIAQNPATLNNAGIFTLSLGQPIYQPALTAAPTTWTVALHFTDGGFNAPGRIDFDTQGNVWSNNNFDLPIGNTAPGTQMTVLSPTGQPIFGSPIQGAGLYGSGYGIAIAPTGEVWLGNFSNSTLSKFAADGSPLANIPASKGNLDNPMGMAFDQDGNLWICNMGDISDASDFGSVTVYLKGDPNRALTFTHDPIDPLKGVHKPFSVAIDQKGRAWIANSGFAPVAFNAIVLELKQGRIRVAGVASSPGMNAPADPTLPKPYGEFVSPKTIAIDSNGNAWVANFEANLVTFIDGKTLKARDIVVDSNYHGWGVAVDSSDRVWTASFSNSPSQGLLQTPPSISVLQANPSGGSLLYTFSNPALQHVTALQTDQSGNVWAVNNWSLASTANQIIGGDGLMEFLGLASPVNTPLANQYANSAKKSSP